MKQCPVCEQETFVNVDDLVNNINGHTFVVKGSRCTSCREEFVNEEEGQAMIQAARRLGIWGRRGD